MDRKQKKDLALVVGLVLVVASFVVLGPATQSWFNNPAQTSYVVVVFFGENILWHSGQLTLTYEDGQFEILDVDQPSPRTGDDGEDLGFKTYVRAGRNFTTPESLEIEYFCSGLDLTVGPFSFTSNEQQVLYSDASGQIIEMWTGLN